MITGLHALIYSDDAPVTRAFFRDVLGMGSVEHGEGSGWLIFGTGPSELGVHPTSEEWEGKLYESPRHHQISFVADDLAATVGDLEAKGAEFTSAVVEEVFGLTITLAVPGADDIMIDQPSYTPAFDA